MSEFDILDQYVLDKLDIESVEVKSCLHEECITDKNSMICVNCGECVHKIYNQHRDWKSQQTRTMIEEKSIVKDIEHMQFSENIVQLANSLYIQVTHDKIYRGNARKGIIAACIFHAFKITSRPQIFKKIIQLFNITKKIGLKGLKFVSIHAPKTSVIFKTQITPLTYVEFYMSELCANDEDMKYLRNLYMDLEKKKCDRLNRPRPQSVASGLVYYWILDNGHKITLKAFSKITGLSELTIAKLEKDIRSIFSEK